MKPRMVIAGANGFMGLKLVEYFAPHYEIHTLTRCPLEQNRLALRLELPHAHNHHWNGKTLGDWAAALDGAEVLINLAGRSVNCRYTAENRREILESRTQSTQVLGQAIAQAKNPPKVWLNSSTATIYRHAQDRPQTDESGEIGSGFSVEVAKAWEKTLFDAPTPQTRKVALRTAMVLGQQGGVLPVLANLARYGLGGSMAGGQQRISWVHERDVCRAIQFLIDSEYAGPINLSAPHPLTNTQFMSGLRQHLKQPIGLPATRWMLELGAFFLQTETELILKSRWVLPTRLEGLGFGFQFPELWEALEDLLNPTHPT